MLSIEAVQGYHRWPIIGEWSGGRVALSRAAVALAVASVNAPVGVLSMRAAVI
jgi:hypothetical protein